MDISTSDIVLSIAGHDQGKLFFVVAQEDGYVFLADGITRKIENPKRKKRKHICHVARIESRVATMLRQGDTVLNSELRKELAIYRHTFCHNQGGHETWQKTT